MTDKVVIRLINPKPKDAVKETAPETVVVYYWHRIAGAVAIAVLVLAALIAGLRSLQRPSGDDPVMPVAELARPKAPPVPAAPSATTPPQVRNEPTPLLPEAAAPTPEPQLSATPTPAPKLSPAPARETPLADAEIVHPSPNRPSKVIIHSRNIRRAQLTSHVVDNEPVDEMARVIPMNAQGLLKVYLHTEVAGLRGRVLFHDWYWKNKLIARVRVPVKEDKQISATSKFIDRIMTGPWQVKVVDERKKVYAQGNFEVQ